MAPKKADYGESEIVYLIQFIWRTQSMCERRDKKKASSYGMKLFLVFPVLAAPESRCEEHENDLSMRHKYLNLKRSNIDAGDSRIKFAPPSLSFSLAQLQLSRLLL